MFFLVEIVIFYSYLLNSTITHTVWIHVVLLIILSEVKSLKHVLKGLYDPSQSYKVNL